MPTAHRSTQAHKYRGGGGSRCLGGTCDSMPTAQRVPTRMTAACWHAYEPEKQGQPPYLTRSCPHRPWQGRGARPHACVLCICSTMSRHMIHYEQTELWCTAFAGFHDHVARPARSHCCYCRYCRYSQVKAGPHLLPGPFTGGEVYQRPLWPAAGGGAVATPAAGLLHGLWPGQQDQAVAARPGCSGQPRLWQPAGGECPPTPGCSSL